LAAPRSIQRQVPPRSIVPGAIGGVPQMEWLMAPCHTAFTLADAKVGQLSQHIRASSGCSVFGA